MVTINELIRAAVDGELQRFYEVLVHPVIFDVDEEGDEHDDQTALACVCRLPVLTDRHKEIIQALLHKDANAALFPPTNPPPDVREWIEQKAKDGDAWVPPISRVRHLCSLESGQIAAEFKPRVPSYTPPAHSAQPPAPTQPGPMPPAGWASSVTTGRVPCAHYFISNSCTALPGSCQFTHELPSGFDHAALPDRLRLRNREPTHPSLNHVLAPSPGRPPPYSDTEYRRRQPSSEYSSRRLSRSPPPPPRRRSRSPTPRRNQDRQDSHKRNRSPNSVTRDPRNVRPRYDDEPAYLARPPNGIANYKTTWCESLKHCRGRTAVGDVAHSQRELDYYRGRLWEKQDERREGREEMRMSTTPSSAGQSESRLPSDGYGPSARPNANSTPRVPPLKCDFDLSELAALNLSSTDLETIRSALQAPMNDNGPPPVLEASLAYRQTDVENARACLADPEPRFPDEAPEARYRSYLRMCADGDPAYIKPVLDQIAGHNARIERWCEMAKEAADKERAGIEAPAADWRGVEETARIDTSRAPNGTLGIARSSNGFGVAQGVREAFGGGGGR